ncbi:MAG TPA: hypothetical protein VKE22_01155 [Haliangiales bacterium]|nr:hypothetical protein [Haliangiales bacterium]
MRTRLTFGLVATVGALLTGGIVLAQDAGPVPAKPDVEVPGATRAEISPSDMVKQVADYKTRMEEMLKHIVQLQDQAKRLKDVIKLNCINDKELQLKAVLNIADQANTNLVTAIARGDEADRYHQFGRITLAYQESQRISAEAEQCVGEELTYLGKTTVTVEEPRIPEDPTVFGEPGFPVVDPLPVGSPKS